MKLKIIKDVDHTAIYTSQYYSNDYPDGGFNYMITCRKGTWKFFWDSVIIFVFIMKKHPIGVYDFLDMTFWLWYYDNDIMIFMLKIPELYILFVIPLGEPLHCLLLPFCLHINRATII